MEPPRQRTWQILPLGNQPDEILMDPEVKKKVEALWPNLRSKP
jgi:hypothetical protein